MITLVVLFLPLPAQAQQVTDYVALVDVSESMFDRHEETVLRVLNEVVSEQLADGDTFHLLSFGEEPEFEMSSRLEGEASVEKIVSHLLLLKPLESSTDFTAAMKYLVEYVDGLSLSSKKRVLIITDGNNDPPPDSPYRDHEENRQRIRELSQYMKRNGWDVKVLRFADEGEEMGEDSLLAAIEESFDRRIVVTGRETTTGGDVLRPAVEVSFPGDVQKGRNTTEVPFRMTNPGEQGRTLRIGEVRSGGENLLTEPRSVTFTPGETRSVSLSLRIPEEVEAGQESVEVELVAAQGGPLDPARGTLQMRRSRGIGVLSSGSSLLWIVLGVVVLVLIVLLIRRLFTAAESEEKRRPAASAASEETGESTLRGASGRRSAESTAADLLSGAGRSTGTAETTLPGTAPDSREETALSSPERSEGREAADILSQASHRSESGAGSVPESAAEGAEQVLQRSARERRARQQRTQRTLRAGLPARGDSGGGVHLPSPRSASRKTLSDLRREGNLPVEMKVSFQRNTGGVNLLWFEEGTSRTVGAPGEADYSVTAVPVDGVIGHVVMERGTLVFYSESRRYFPEVDKPVRNCLKTPILLRSPETEEEATIRFQEYVHPLERINRIMHLIDSPGKPDFDY